MEMLKKKYSNIYIMSHRISCNMFRLECKPDKKKDVKNTTLNKNGSNESTKLRYGKVVARNRKSSGRTIVNCSKM